MNDKIEELIKENLDCRECPAKELCYDKDGKLRSYPYCGEGARMSKTAVLFCKKMCTLPLDQVVSTILQIATGNEKE